MNTLSTHSEPKYTYMGGFYGDHREDTDGRAVVVEMDGGQLVAGYISHGTVVLSDYRTIDQAEAEKQAEHYTAKKCGIAPVKGNIGVHAPKRERPMYGFAELGKALA